MDIDSVESIEIEVNKYRKWVKNAIQIVVDKDLNIHKKNKKAFRSRIKVRYPYGECLYQAKVRQSGDWKDHIVYEGGDLVQSLDVKLEQGNIAGVVRFKLFLPETRSSDNEIIGAYILRELGYLSPLTAKMKVNFNGVDLDYIFQEKSVKEMLESNSRREGPVFEGDESLLWLDGSPDEFKYEDISLTKLSNKTWAGKGKESLAISLDSYMKLQRMYMDMSNLGRQAMLDWDVDGEDINEKMYEYDFLIMSMAGSHSLRGHNRKFYYNPVRQKFEPVYYDGNFNPGKLRQSFIWSDFKYYKEKLSNNFFKNIKQRIRSLDTVLIEKNIKNKLLNGNGIKVSEFVGSMIDNLDLLEKRVRKNQQGYVNVNSIENEHRARFFNNSKAGKLVDILTEKNGYYGIRVCDGKGCVKNTVDSSVVVGWLSRNNASPDNNIYIVNYSVTEKHKHKDTFIDGINIRVRHSYDAEVIYDSQRKEISFIQSNPDDWFYLEDTRLDNASINFIGEKGVGREGQRFNEYGLTGCLNFMNVSFDGVRIVAKNGACEDSVNILNSRGTISALKIDSAYADALDADFSNLELNNVSVISSGNDCLDFSYGQYTVTNAALSKCGDKGVSVGEKSIFNADTLNITQVKSAITVKDSSRGMVKNLSTTQAAHCGEAYNKKQEFHGAVLNIDEHNCDIRQFYSDENSVVKLQGK